MRRAVCLALALGVAQAAAAQEPPPVRNGTESGRTLRAPGQDDSFSFAIFGDRTGGPVSGLKVLRDAVTMTNHLDPSFVMTVGDMVQGYTTAPRWLRQMRQYKGFYAEEWKVYVYILYGFFLILTVLTPYNSC